MKAFWILFVIVNINQALAQSPQHAKIKAGADKVGNIPNQQKYQYAEFLPGKLVFNTGANAPGKFNYNILLGEVHFIPPSGDTLALANEFTIKHVIIGQDTFYYDSKAGYLQVVGNYQPVKLAVQRKLAIIKNGKESGYDQTSSVSAIRQYSSYSDANGRIRTLSPKTDVLLSKVSTYYIIDLNQRTYPASKAALITIFNKHKSDINQFIKVNKISFHEDADLRKILQFCHHFPR